MTCRVQVEDNSTLPGLTEDALNDAIAGLYRRSDALRTVLDYVSRGRYETGSMGALIKPDIHVNVSDAVPEGETRWLNKAAWEMNPANGPWPYAAVDFLMLISPQDINGNFYDNDGIENDIRESFESLFSHELSHILKHLINSLGITGFSMDDDDVVALANLIMAQGGGWPDDVRQSHGHAATDLDNEDPLIVNISDQDPLPCEPKREKDLPTIEDIKDILQNAREAASPLILDLDDSGTVDLISLENSNVYWDIDQDGFRELSGWVSAVDGLLALDINQNGSIDDNSELFGTAQTDGFSILAEHDSNKDRQITVEDSIWDRLVVWQDLDEDGYSESGEMHALNSLNIVSINLDATVVSDVNEGHAVTHISSYTVDDGISAPDARAIHDVWFEYDNVYSIFDAGYTISIDSLLTGVNLRGYGDIADLQIGMSLDHDLGDPDSLVSLVSDFAMLSVAELFDDTDDKMNLVRDILFRWAAVEAVTPDSRGPNIDARELEFLEKYTGQPFLQRGHMSDPGQQAAADLKEAYHIVQKTAYARLIAQVTGDELFEGDWYYDISSDSIVGATGLNEGTIDDLETLGLGMANKDIFWANVIRVIEYTIGVDNLSGGDQTYLENAIIATDNTLSLQGIVDSLAWVAPSGSTYNGTSGNDVLTGGSGNDELNGDYGDDTLNGGTGVGDDDLNGGADDDILWGKGGQDYLRGGLGNDLYMYDVNDGHDILKEQGVGTGNDDDRIVFGAGIDIGDLTFSRVGNTDLRIDIDTGSYESYLIIEDQFNYSTGGGHIEWLEFDDTSTYDLDGQSWATYGTAGADDIRGVRDGYGGLGNDTIYGLGGNDLIRVNAPNETDYLANTVYGGDGNDEIYGDDGADTLYGDNGNDYIEGGGGADTLSGGAGDDQLIGELGNDTFIYSAGHDYINDNSGTDAINLDAAWNGVTPLYLRTNNTLTVWFDANNTITINNHYSGNAVESMVYANSTTVNLTTVSAVSQGDDSGNTLNGTTGVDTIYGNGGNDTIDAKGGNDTVYGGSGDDYIEGGSGNDYLDGGPGSDSIEGGGDNDTYYYSSGHDWFNDTSGTDTLVFANGWTIEQMTFNRYVADIDDMVIEINGSNSVTIEGQFGNSKKLETFTWQAGSVSSATIVVTAHGTSGNDTISGFTYGGSTNDIVYGYDGADTLTGGDGNDTLYGGNGNDTLVGSNDNDVLYGGAGDDYMGGASSGNGGNDTFVYESGLDTVTDYLGSSSSDTLWISGGRTINDIASFANSGSNDTLLTITASVDEILVKYLRGGSQHHVEWVTFDDGFTTSLPDYASWINGTSGNDVAAGNGSDNTIVGFAGNDTITGAGGNDEAHGGAGDDSLDGGDGTDLLYGGDGDDTLYGKAGLDTMHGGDGADTFVFETASAFSDIDVIRDFSVGDDDVLDLTDILDTVYDPMTDAISDFVEFTESSGSTFVSVDRDGTGGTYSMAQIVKLENVTGLASPESLELNGNLLAA